MAGEPLSQKDADDLAGRVGAALRAAVGDGRFANPEGWRVQEAGARSLMGGSLPVVTLAREGATLSFIVAPTDPAQKAFDRTADYDVTYFSEDVGDDDQQEIWDRDRETIVRFVAWLDDWNEAERADA